MTISEALKASLIAYAAHEDAKASCDPHNWDYFGFRYREALDKAEENFLSALNEHIDSRVREVIEGKK